MRPDILRTLDELGQLANTTQLRNAGHSRRELDHALAAGFLHRVCRGWVATALAPRSAVTAVLRRGKLTGTAALASYGVWDGLDRRLHVHVPRNSHGPVRSSTTPLSQFAPEEYPRRGLEMHWLAERFPVRHGPVWRVSVEDALLRAARDLPREQFIACLDSALNTRVLSRAALPELFAALPLRFQPLCADIEPLAESGLETLARLRLTPLVDDIQPQVWFDGIGAAGGHGRVDLLLDKWLVIELDGDRYHDQFEDRRRTSVLVRQGLRLHRFGYHDVVHEWELAEATVLELLRVRR